MARQPEEASFSNFKFFTTRDGFYADNVTDITQDSLGFLWLGTSEGLYLYDGNTFSMFESFTAQSDLLTAKILCIFKDRNQDLWIGTSKGLVLYKHLEGDFKTISLQHQSDYVSSIAQDRNGTIWLGTDNGIFTIDSGLTVRHVFPGIHCPILLARKEKTDRVFFVTYNHIVTLDAISCKVLDSIRYSNDRAVTDNYHTDAIIDKHDQLWISKYDGDLVQYALREKTLKVHNLKTRLLNPSAAVNHFFCRDTTRLWLTINEGGIVYYDYAENSFCEFETPAQNHIPNYKVSAFFIDREDNYWFAMEKTGLAMTNSYVNRFHHFTHPPFGKNRIISAILKDSEDNLWVGSDGGGLYLFDDENTLIQTFKNDPDKKGSLSNDAVLSLYEDSKKRIWVGTFRGGLSLFDKKAKTFRHYTENKDRTKGPLRNDIRKIVEDRAGNLWLVVHGKGVSCFNPRQETFTHYSNLKGLWTTDLCISKNRSVWVASSNGVVRKMPGQKNFGPVSGNTLPETVINCLYEDYQGKMWLGTLHGMYGFDARNNRFQKLNLSPLLSKASVKSINQDASGQYYIATNIGLFRLNAEKSIIDWFGEDDGLINEDFTINASCNKNNVLYLGTSDGCCWFDLSAGLSPEAHIPIYLTDIKVFNKSIRFDKPYGVDKAIPYIHNLKLAYDQNYLTFNFAFPSFITGKSNINFEYKLEGFDKNWRSGNRELAATYTSIPPGNYTLLVRLTRPDAYPSHNGELRFSLFILPPFYETWWFRLLLTGLVVLSLFLYYKIKTRQLARTNRLLETKIRERTAEIQQQNEKLEAQRKELELTNATKDKLFSIIAHDLRSPFTTILAMSEYLVDQVLDKSSEKVRDITKGIYKASNNAHQILENLLQWAQTQTRKIEFSPEWVCVDSIFQSLIEGCELQCIEKNITIDYRSPETFDACIDSSMFETIIRNLLNNAIKYSLRGSSIVIEIHSQTEGFAFTIKDQGIGMDKEKIDQILHGSVHSSEYGTSGEKGTGLGLTVVKEFIQYHRAHWKIISEKNQGTSITIEFPCVVRPSEAKEGISLLRESVEIESAVTTTTQNIPDEETLRFLKTQTLLIVDDQKEIRKSIALQLEGKIQILEASNGKEALGIAENVMPDLIISDVIMPEMNGMEFSKKIKNDILTSHIPIILLTSQKEEKDVVAGLQTGVDDYILKPFQPTILLLKITNLLLNRERLRKKFSLNDDVFIHSMREDSLDRQFLVKVMAVIEKNLSNETFSVEMLGEEVAMHRSSLAKKIGALTGMKPNELIRSQRMKFAARLLLASGKNISEVAYESGFSDPKYFSKSFKAYFGCLPSDYLKESKQSPGV